MAQCTIGILVCERPKYVFSCGCTTRETMTRATKKQQKTVEGFCGFGRVVGVILQRKSVVWALLNRSFVDAHSRVRGLPTGSL
jgi:hypothetical protein